MSGSGGYKHRQVALGQKTKQRDDKARANIRRVRNQFEKRGQAWEPENNPQQMGALNHAARRLILSRQKASF